MRLTLLLCLLALSPAWGQTWFAPATLPVQGLPQDMAWAGGLGSPQFSEGDINGDGLTELAVFDRQAWSWKVFARQGGVWTPAPDLAAMLPRCRNWALLRDYNHDGFADVFTDNINSVALYRNTAAPGGRGFELAYAVLLSTSFAGGPLSISVVNTDIPGILDVDGDQDLDIVTFDDLGAAVLLHRNLSRDSTGGFDPVRFRKEACWGRFVESSAVCDLYNLNVACRVGVESDLPGPVPAPQAPNHIGSTILPFDADGDGDLDALIGDVACRDLNLLTNGAGVGAAPNMNVHTAPWPAAANGRPASMDLFPAAYQIDLDGDGTPDLISALNIAASAGNGLPNFQRSTLAYRNAGTPQAPNYQFAGDAFLQAGMIDHGTESVPCWIDIDADGDKDLLIGSTDRVFNGQLSAGLTLYRNNAGTLVQADTNFLGYLSRLGRYANPFAADFTGDGRPDLGLILPRGFNGSSAIFIPMNADVGTDGTALNYAREDTLRFNFLPADQPAFVDHDGDGDPDMVLGRDDGSLCLVENIGSSTNPLWGPLQRGFLGLPAGVNFGCKPVVADFDGNGLPDVVVSLGNKPMRLYANPVFLQSFVGTYDTAFYQNNSRGEAARPAAGVWNPAVADDFNGDGRPDLTFGTATGGVVLLENRHNIPLGTRAAQKVELGRLLGNPAAELSLWLAGPATLRVRDAAGRLLHTQALPGGAHRHLYRAAAPGLYVVELETGAGRQALRWAAHD